MVTTTATAAVVGAGGPPLPLAALLVLLLPPLSPPRAAEGAAGLAESVIWAVNAGGEAHVDVHGIHFRKDPLEGRVGRGEAATPPPAPGPARRPATRRGGVRATSPEGRGGWVGLSRWKPARATPSLLETGGWTPPPPMVGVPKIPPPRGLRGLGNGGV